MSEVKIISMDDAMQRFETCELVGGVNHSPVRVAVTGRWVLIGGSLNLEKRPVYIHTEDWPAVIEAVARLSSELKQKAGDYIVKEWEKRK